MKKVPFLDLRITDALERKELFESIGRVFDHAGIIKLMPLWRKTMIRDQALQEFKMIWKNETGQDMTDKEALDAAVALLHHLCKVSQAVVPRNCFRSDSSLAMRAP